MPQLEACPKDSNQLVLFAAEKTFKVLEYLDEELVLSDSQIKQVYDVEGYVGHFSGYIPIAHCLVSTIAAIQSLISTYAHSIIPGKLERKEYEEKQSELKAQLKTQCRKLREASVAFSLICDLLLILLDVIRNPHTESPTML